MNDEVKPGRMVLTRRTRQKGEHRPEKSQQLELLGLQALEDPASTNNGALSYMANILVRLTMPHRQLKDDAGKPISTFERAYNSVSIAIQAHPRVGLPYGSIPRILMSYVTTEAVRTRQPLIHLGNSAADFLAKLGYSTSGGARGDATRVREQMKRLFASHISVIDERREQFGNLNMSVAKRQLMWWDAKAPDQLSLFNATVELSTDFFDEVVNSPVPVDMRALQALSHSPMALDIYCYSTWRAFWQTKVETIDWAALQVQFGANYPLTAAGRRDFRNAFRAHAKSVVMVYPELRLDLDSTKYARFLPSKTHVPEVPLQKALARASRSAKSG